jgi:HemY protein
MRSRNPTGGTTDVSALRILFWLTAFASLAIVAAWLADNPGAVILDWGPYRVETTAAILVALAVVLLLALLWLTRLGRWIARGTPAVRESRRRRGYRALTRGLVAVAAGDGDDARRLAKRAKSLIKGDQPLTLVLLAQAAQLAGDAKGAHQYFTQMLDSPDTEFLGLRGLIVEAERTGDKDTALSLARRAEALRPNTPWIMGTLFELETQQGLWADAHKTVVKSARKKLVEPGDARRRKAVVLLQQARQDEAAGDTDAATEAALQACGFAPDFAPAAALAAHLMTPARPRKAARIVERAWRAQPHPDLARVYVKIHQDDLPARRVKRMTRLAGMNVGHVESRLAVAEQALGAGLWGVAWNNLRPLVDGNEALSARACRLVAQYQEDGNGDPSAAQDWQDRAAKAPEGPIWRCRECGHVASDWLALCPSCDGFDTSEWRNAVEIVSTPGTGAIIDGETHG